MNSFNFSILNVTGDGFMNADEYNYDTWTMGGENFESFATEAPKVTSRAPSFPVEELSTGKTVHMKQLWQKGITIIEFGSFT